MDMDINIVITGKPIGGVEDTEAEGDDDGTNLSGFIKPRS
jgi:hypothetical protein